MKNQVYPGDGLYIDLYAAAATSETIPFEAYGQLWITEPNGTQVTFVRLGPVGTYVNRFVVAVDPVIEDAEVVVFDAEVLEEKTFSDTIEEFGVEIFEEPPRSRRRR